MPSIFTKIIDREIPASIIYEDDNHIAFLDINPLEKGHTLVVPKKEYKDIFEMPEEAYLELQRVVLKISKSYEKRFQCGINIIQNNKEISGQDVFHVHFHVIPRFKEKTFLNFDVWEKYGENEMEEFQDNFTLI